MNKLSIVLVFVLLAASGQANAAGSGTDLQQRVVELEQEVEQLKQSLGQENGTSTTLKKYVWSNLDIELYGYIKLDAAYDNSRINNGNYADWVSSESPNNNDDQFNITARQTRLGLNIFGPDDGEIVTSGKIEFDFYGTNGSSSDMNYEGKAGIMLRHAYMKLDWPEKKFNIIAGQTSDVISPLYPDTINYTVGWWTGNIGYRRPQIRATKTCDMENGDTLKFEAAVARTNGRNSVSNTDSGEDEGFPTLQGRVSITTETFGPQPATIGLSGHWGEEEYDTNPAGSHQDFESWSMNLDYTQPVSEKVTIKAEVFKGENLDAYLGGIGQGVTLTTPNIYDEIGSKGGWVAASLGPWKNKKYNIGLAFDDVNRDNVNNGSRTLNRSIFANVICALNANTDIGFELSHWRTEYKGSGDGDAIRAQLAFIYKF